MKTVLNHSLLLMAAMMLTCTFTACEENDADDTTTSAVSEGSDKKGWTDADYKNKAYGNAAMEACNDLVAELENATAVVGENAMQHEATLKAVFANNVDNVIVPTYRALGDAVEKLQAALGDLSAADIKQSNVDAACEAFKTARAEWEKSEAFLMGPASDFSIDPHIDSWPLDRNELLSYFSDTSMEIENESSILGFHALEFILFRNGQNRKVAEFQGFDTYKGFEKISGAQELAYAERVAKDLLVHVYELEVAWDASNTKRLNAVIAAGLGYQTDHDISYGENMKSIGSEKSTIANVFNALQDVLSADEGSCTGICDEVGSAKIGHPFKDGDVSYVESPYSYNSILDFQNNIRSIENLWYGSRQGKSANVANSLHAFFTANYPQTAKKIETAIENAINAIGGMPSPFVKYVCTLHGKVFEDEVDLTEYE